MRVTCAPFTSCELIYNGGVAIACPTRVCFFTPLSRFSFSSPSSSLSVGIVFIRDTARIRITVPFFLHFLPRLRFSACALTICRSFAPIIHAPRFFVLSLAREGGTPTENHVRRWKIGGERERDPARRSFNARIIEAERRKKIFGKKSEENELASSMTLLLKPRMHNR